MKSFMFLLALGLVSAEKLDRTYLPPPDSKFSGGSAGDLQVPLEFPKETYTTTAPFTPGQQTGLISPGDKRITVGIDRGTGLPGQSQDSIPVTPANRSPFNSFQNTYKVPTTTTSYAFTQTTTLAPVEGIGSTLSPLGTGIPIVGPFGQQPDFVGFSQPNQGQFNQQIGQSQPGGFIPGSQIIPTPGYQPVPNVPSFVDGRPQYYSQPQNVNQYQQGIPSSTVSPTPGTNVQPGFSPSYNQGYTQHLGVQPPNQPGIVNPQGTFPSTTASPGYYYPGVTSQYNDNANNYTQGTIIPGSYIPQQPTQTIVQQGPYSTPGVQPGVTEYVDKFDNVQQVAPGSTLNHQVAGQPQVTGQQVPFQKTGPQYGSNFILPNATLGSIQQGQRPQFIGQQGSLFPTGSPSGPIGPSVTGSQQQYPQGPQSPGVYPPTGISPTTLPGSAIPQQQPQFPGQQGSFPSTTAQGLPSFYPGTNQLGGDLNNVPGGAIPGTDIPQIIPGHQPVSGIQQHQGPYGQNQITDGRFPSQQGSRPGDQTVISGSPQYGYRPDPTTPSSNFPSSVTQQSFPSAAPSSPTYGTTPAGVFSSTSAYSGYDNQGQTHPERPQAESGRNAVILNYENVRTPDGYAYSFDTSNGIHGDENGTTVGGTRANGSYSYIGDDGKFYSVVYSADENGFQPHGDHIPTPPPVPEAIQRVIEQAEKDKEAGISHDGFYDEEKYGHKKYQGPKYRRPQVPGRITEITNGADIPEPQVGEKDSIKKIGSHGGRRPVTSQDDRSSEETKELDRDIKDQSGDAIKGGKQKIRPYGKTPSRQPTVTKQEYGDYEYDIEDDQNIRVDGSRKPTGSRTDERTQSALDRTYYSLPKGPTRKQKPSQDRYGASQDEYEETEDFENKPGKNYDRNGRLPSKMSESKYESGGDIVTGRPYSTKRPGSQSTRYDSDEETDVTVTYGINRKPQKPMRGPSKTYGIKYSVSGDKEDDYYQEPQEHDLDKDGQSVTGRPKDYKRPGSTETKYKQTSQRPGSQDESYDDNLDYSDGVRFEQKGRPSHDQRSQVGGTTTYPQRQLEDETGYHYTPPQNKFGQTETTRFPSRISEEGKPQPSTKYEADGTRTTLKPFMTPNVHSGEDESYEEGSDERLPKRKPGYKPGKETTSTTSEDGYDTDAEDIDSDQDIGDEEITTTKVRPGKFGSMSSTRRPLHQTKQSTGRPQYAETEDDETTHKRPLQPGQKSGDRYSVGQKTKGRRPGQDYTQRTPERTKTPGYNFVSSTTPMPSRGTTRITSKRPGFTQEEQSQYPTTYEPSDTSNTEDDYSEGSTGPFKTTGSTFRRPSTKPGSYFETTSGSGKPGSRTPSRPTSRLGYDYTDITKIPGFPSSTPEVPVLRGSPTKPGEYYPGSTAVTPGTTVIQSSRPTLAPTDRYFYPNQSGSTFIPGSTTTFGRTEYPDRTVTGSVTSIPSGTSRISEQPGDLPSTTYRPNYSITDITQPGTVNVDAFGRPITRPGQEVSGTRRPGVTGTTVQEAGLPSTAGYQDAGIIKPGSKVTFSPGDTRFEQPDFVSTQGSTTYPGQKPAEFGPSSFTTPGYLGPYSTTERVIGEDFSGPKQPQRYDPQTGYYYKK